MGMTASNLLRGFWLKRSALALAAALQLGCSVVFVSDIIHEWATMTVHTWAELLAVGALIVGAWLAVAELRKLIARNIRVERELDAACGAFQSVIERHFEIWGLSKAEKDVALLSIKGMSNTEIARMRVTREGTIKAQSAAIYRKAGVSSRADLISAVIEDLIAGLAISEREAT
jgi:DNA-binding NarL/FixJ family response regulator